MTITDQIGPFSNASNLPPFTSQVSVENNQNEVRGTTRSDGNDRDWPGGHRFGTLEIVDEFQRFVRPQINPILTDFCKKLTSIQQADVDGARTYQEVGEELRTFASRYVNAAWASWGDYDARQLERDAGFAGCPSMLEGLPHFNARKWHAGLYDNRTKDLKQKVESMGLVWQGSYHRGIDDARNVASIVKEMLA